MGEKEMWPSELVWNFIDAEPEETPKDAGFYDAAFGPIFLRVICTADGRFRVAVADDAKVEIVDPGTVYTDLDAAKAAACALGSQILFDGVSRLAHFVGNSPFLARVRALAGTAGTNHELRAHRQLAKVANFTEAARERGLGPTRAQAKAEARRISQQVGELIDKAAAELPRFDVVVELPALDEIDPVDIADCAVLQSILQLADADVPMEVIEKWTPEERKQAQDWAGAVHLSASDNDDVVVPPKPKHVADNAKPVDLERL